MNEDLAALLADRLRLLPFAGRVAGLTVPFERELPDTDNRTKMERWPLALRLPEDAADCERDQAYLLPDASVGSLVFFEDGTTTAYTFPPAGVAGYQTTFRLLGWVNPAALSAPVSGTVLSQAVEQALKACPLPLPWQLLQLSVTHLPGGPSLWNGYTLAANPLLLPPYRLLGLEVVARYVLCPPTELPTLVTPPTC